jgi:pimeloyl-[acyl-carrier protein] synthase
VLHRFTADRTPTPPQLSAMGCSALNPIAQVMVTRLRSLASGAFSTSRLEAMRGHIQDIADRLIGFLVRGRTELITDFAERSRRL